MKNATLTAKRKISVLVKTVACLALLCTSRIASAGSADEDLLKQANRVFGPLPQVMASEQNPVTPEKVKLGKLLFFEPRISVDGTISCAKCHPISLYAADGLRKAVGNNCRANPRNSPTIFNAADQISAHWIGNRTDVEDQARQSVTGPPAFGMPSNEAVEKKLKEFKEYRRMFKEAFPGDKDPVTVDNLAKAVGAYERTLVTPAPFDAYIKGNINALTGQQKRGLKTFIDAGCLTCHFSAYFGGRVYQKFGVWEPYWKYTKSEPVDEGRYVVTRNDADKYVFKVPVLRNVEKTPPYFHDGSVDKLGDAITIMGKIQLGKELTKKQVDDLISFLSSLTGEIPDDAVKAPILPSME